MATVKPAAGFNAEKDAEALRKAMKGLGTDEQAIIDVMCYRSWEQRLAIVKEFKTMFGKDLIKELKSELKGHFEDILVGLCRDPIYYQARGIKKAVKGAGTDEDALVEIICTKTNAEMELIKKCYKEEFGKEAEEDVAGDCSGHFKRLLVSSLQANRNESPNVDAALAQEEAQKLFDAGEGKLGTDESAFNRVLATRSPQQLAATFEAYAKIAHYDIKRTIEHETSGHLKDGYLAVVKSIEAPADYWAERLYKSMKGMGTDDDTLVRVVLSRCEVDMENIKTAFMKNYGKSLAKMIKDDCSGDYKKALFALIGDKA